MEKLTNALKEMDYDNYVIIATKGDDISLVLAENAIMSLGMIEYARLEARRQIGGHNDESDELTDFKADRFRN